jgi:hypothetical protein
MVNVGVYRWGRNPKEIAVSGFPFRNSQIIAVFLGHLHFQLSQFKYLEKPTRIIPNPEVLLDTENPEPRLEQFVASVLADVEDPGSELPIEMREQWVKLDERQRQKRLPETIQRIVYTHSTGEVTIEINPEAIAEFATNEAQTEDENPSIGISK